MKRNIAFAIAGIFLLLNVTEASFPVYLRDGSRKLVDKIVFQADFVDLHVTNGLVTRVRVEAIEYRATGITRPGFPYGVCTDGKTVQKTDKPQSAAKESAPLPMKSAVSQSELQRQWEDSTQVVTAGRDFGSLRKGQKARVTSSTDLTVTIIFKDEKSGEYRRTVVDQDAYNEIFKSPDQMDTKPAKPALAPAFIPPEMPAKPAIPKREPPPPAPKSGGLPMWAPPAMSLGFLLAGFVISIVVFRLNPPPKPKASTKPRKP